MTSPDTRKCFPLVSPSRIRNKRLDAVLNKELVAVFGALMELIISWNRQGIK